VAFSFFFFQEDFGGLTSTRTNFLPLLSRTWRVRLALSLSLAVSSPPAPPLLPASKQGLNLSPSSRLDLTRQDLSNKKKTTTNNEQKKQYRSSKKKKKKKKPTLKKRMARFTLLSLARSLVAPLALAAALLFLSSAEAGVPTTEVDKCQALLTSIQQGNIPAATQANIDLLTRCLQLLGYTPQAIQGTLIALGLIAGLG